MPRRLNYTGRKKINRADAVIRVQRNGEGIMFDADLRLADYKLDQIVPPPKVYVEAYRGASALWKRFEFGRAGAIKPPDDRSLNEFGDEHGILFRVKVSAAEGDTLGQLLAEADGIHPRLPDDQDAHGEPLIRHRAANDIGDEIWRVDFDDVMPLLKINDRVQVGVDQFLRDPKHRAVFAPAVMRQVLTRIMVIDRDAYDDEDESCWQKRWLTFASSLPGVGDRPDAAEESGRLTNLINLERWIDDAVEAFVSRAGLFATFASPVNLEDAQ